MMKQLTSTLATLTLVATWFAAVLAKNTLKENIMRRRHNSGHSNSKAGCGNV